MSTNEIIATTALGIEDLVAAEFTSYGARDVRITPSAVLCQGDLGVAYRACLWSRTASRILWSITKFAAESQEALYEGLRAIPWGEHLGPDETLAVDFSSRSGAISDTRFGAQRSKDAIVDRLRDDCGRRPSIDRVAADVRVKVHLERDTAAVAIDLFGQGLHRRGYRQDGDIAPLRETLAAAVLLRSRWPAAVSQGGSLIDPMCGSGTIVIEAALMALDIAPGLLRDHHGFSRWRGHDARLFEKLRSEARERRRESYDGVIAGFDLSPAAIDCAHKNADRAGVLKLLQFAVTDIADAAPPAATTSPLHVVVNPPYGHRLGDLDERTRALYATLGQTLKLRFRGSRAHVLTSEEELARAIGLAASRVNHLRNGALACTLYHYEIHDGAKEASATPRAPRVKKTDEGLANRLRKNQKNLERWAKREGISCYRLYDADLPEYAAAIDRYGDRVHIQEYAPPASIDPALAKQRLAMLVGTVKEVLALPSDHIYLKKRRIQRRKEQYQKLDSTREMHAITEGGHRFLVNLTDRLDTGIFLDARPVRALVARLAPQKRFLNLFAYTATATVYAARAGARSSVSVDLSNTYLAWAARHLELNGIDQRRHVLVRAECRAWLENNPARFDLILLDPPTFSSSKSMSSTLDIKRDHIALISSALRLLAAGGTLIFCTNNQRFKLEHESLPGVVIKDLTAATIPLDFRRSPRIHKCWSMEKRLV